MTTGLSSASQRAGSEVRSGRSEVSCRWAIAQRRICPLEPSQKDLRQGRKQGVGCCALPATADGCVPRMVSDTLKSATCGQVCVSEKNIHNPPRAAPGNCLSGIAADFKTASITRALDQQRASGGVTSKRGARHTLLHRGSWCGVSLSRPQRPNTPFDRLAPEKVALGGGGERLARRRRLHALGLRRRAVDVGCLCGPRARRRGCARSCGPLPTIVGCVRRGVERCGRKVGQANCRQIHRIWRAVCSSTSCILISGEIRIQLVDFNVVRPGK